ncbi:glycosyltransferase family 2 protein [Dyadobacter tibetensis]|uniref:glycosyltransferase family 2 protein n=1 Tax=Dyadobacter tibetensis TaxID=1211851 RepID=UPI0004712E3F|nr:glycosyltransferase family 2 protein [Dyadobacter tibetensis]
MSFYSMPGWTKAHLFSHLRFQDISPDRIEKLKSQLKKFSPENPEVSVVVPMWNEADNIFRTLSALSANSTRYRTEIIVINNNSTDNSQQVLDQLGVKNFFQPKQGTPYARQLGLEKAKGKYFLCADADTLYPPAWIDLMVEPMVTDQDVTGVYGRYSFIPPEGQGRMGFWFYELFTEIIIRIRQRKRQYLNIYGFNMGLIRSIGLETGGFNVTGGRKYDGAVGNDNENDAEDGRMARNLLTRGRIQLVSAPKARVFTSSRRLMDDGSLWQAFTKRIKYQLRIFKEFT